ncbi:MAG: NCLDV major capsid protein [Barrevirus sp.]|uniref:NCLDV major capsid protein n=1 Tax=Barrevirus sp. TaxID=2487763 RepID=A0A3G4ZQK0_9VIRU|nr:MAG: NCLDV major capsid protein [Barrevirus sp.]
MGGGLIQLVAYSKQDIFLTKDPQITFFKIVYRRHTNFTMECIPQNFLDCPDFGKRVTSVISRNGDLIRNIHLVIDLPNIPVFKDTLTKFAWVKKIGYAIIKSVDIEIGDQLIDRHFGDWLNIWHELTLSDKINVDHLIGSIKELTDFTNGKTSYRLMIPLQFWFNRISGLALPIVSLQLNKVKINVELSEFEKCYNLTPTHYIDIDNAFVNFKPYEYIVQNQGLNKQIINQFVHFDILERRLYYIKHSESPFINNCSIKGLKTCFKATNKKNNGSGGGERSYKNIKLNNISIKKSFLLVEYCFLDDDERARFLKARHEYLIEQVVCSNEVGETVKGLNQSFKIPFTGLTKELIWVTQLKNALNLNQTFNYTDSVIFNKNNKNMIRKETILFNGHERVSMRSSDYFTYLQQYQHHKKGSDNCINVYSFALHPLDHQPSGTVNLTEIENVTLKINVNPLNNDKAINNAIIRIYGIIYNIFRVSNGISGLMFALDYSN